MKETHCRIYLSLLLPFLVLLLAFPALLSAQTSWYVDDDAPGDPGPGDTSISDPLEDGSLDHPFDAIQEAIEATGYHHTVVVRDGTYTGEGNRDMYYHRNSITVRSENGPENCTIDCQGSEAEPHRAFTFHDYQQEDAVLEGFTITGGWSAGTGSWAGGGAILVTIGSPVIRGNVFIGNGGTYGQRGGAIYCYENTYVEIIDNTFINNHSYSAGGAISYFRATMVIQDNEFIANVLDSTSSEQHGSAIYGWQIEENQRASIVGNTFSGHVVGGVVIFMDEARADVAGNTFTGNEALCLQFDKSPSTIRLNTFTGNTGGCIYARYNYSGSPYDSSIDVIGNTFTDNSSEVGAGVWSTATGSIIMDNVFSGNHATDRGGAVYCNGTRSRVLGNLFEENSAAVNGGGLYVNIYSVVVAGNLFRLNHADGQGGGLYVAGTAGQVINNLIVENTAAGEGGGILHGASYVEYRFNTIAGNQALDGGGICLADTHYWSSSITDSILWGNTPDQFFVLGAPITAAYCDVQGGAYGENIINADPLFASGVTGDYLLSAVLAGQADDSPCIGAGSEPADQAMIPVDVEISTESVIELPASSLTTRTDRAGDAGQADMGYHQLISKTVSCGMSCLPASGVLPFTAQFALSLTNEYPAQVRRIQYQVDVTLANGLYYSPWRRGWQNVQAGEDYQRNWGQYLPALGSLTGDNDFLFTATDVTPAPYNQPPYLPSGDTDTAACTVTGLAP